NIKRGCARACAAGTGGRAQSQQNKETKEMNKGMIWLGLAAAMVVMTGCNKKLSKFESDFFN
ncbi:MAG TPA: hypothetical protein DC009_06275, partial [Porphyromonadaceae bacterium]|nr:hypothetical protein [Porphyromonadaceae bacterium]